MTDFYLILNTTLQAHLIACSLDPEQAASIAGKTINDLENQYGGQTVYLKNNRAIKVAEQHKRIIAEFDGTNCGALCRKYQITSVWLKRLLAREKQPLAINSKVA